MRRGAGCQKEKRERVETPSLLTSIFCHCSCSSSNHFIYYLFPQMIFLILSPNHISTLPSFLLPCKIQFSFAQSTARKGSERGMRKKARESKECETEGKKVEEKQCRWWKQRVFACSKCTHTNRPDRALCVCRWANTEAFSLGSELCYRCKV